MSTEATEGTAVIVVRLPGRAVHWEVNMEVAASLLQSLVQGIGPAEEGE